MSRQRSPFVKSSRFLFILPMAGLFLAMALTGCKADGHTSDPRLKKLDEMLDAQLPPGTAKSRVIFYLSSQNFTVESSSDGKSVTSIVHRVDTDTLRPVTARVIFHFDANGQLKTYEMDTSVGAAPQP